MAIKTQKTSRKDKIVQAAIRCFIKSGVPHTTMSEVAEKADVDQPLIHYYFPSLDSLYLDVFNEVLEHLKNHMLTAITREPGDPRKVLAHYIRSYFDWGRENPGYSSLWLHFYYLASYNPVFRQLNTLIRGNGRDRIASILYQGIEKGVFTLPKGGSVNQTAINIQGIITGNSIMAATEGADCWKEFAEAAVQSGLRMAGARNLPA